MGIFGKLFCEARVDRYDVGIDAGAAGYFVAARQDLTIIADSAGQASAFLDDYLAVGSYIRYLEAFASTEGWSGALGDAAFPARTEWENLEAPIKA